MGNLEQYLEQDPVYRAERICEEVFSQHIPVILKEVRKRVRKEVSPSVAVRVSRTKYGRRTYPARSGPLMVGPGEADPAIRQSLVVGCIADIRYPRNKS